MSESFLEQMQKTSHLAGGNVAYIESLYETYLENPNNVPPEWRTYFEKLPRVDGVIASDVPHSTVIRHFELIGRNRLRARPAVGCHGRRQRPRTQTDPRDGADRGVSSSRSQTRHDRSVGNDGTPARRRCSISRTTICRPPTSIRSSRPASFFYGAEKATLRDIVAALEHTYCGSVGAEYMHIVDAAEQLWVQQRLESVRCHPEYGDDVKRMILERLTAAEGLERYLQNKFPGTKRFGLEGGESLIPMLHEAIQRAGSHGIVEMVIAMAHRGRLNVLVNILGKHPRELFDEFEGKLPVNQASGDVKYHQGFSSNVMTPGGEMHLALAFNPSHLEIVGPVAEGSVRARQDRRLDYAGDLVVPVMIHGDAAFSGQGVVMETFQMSQTRGFKTGGTIHLIINNQIGFTTQPAGRRAIDRILHRSRAHGAGADLPRERRRSGRSAVRHAGRGRLSDAVPQGRRDRSRRLSASRPQRSRRADDDAAADVSAHPQAADDAHDLRRKTRRRRRRSRRKTRTRWWRHIGRRSNPANTLR